MSAAVEYLLHLSCDSVFPPSDEGFWGYGSCSCGAHEKRLPTPTLRTEWHARLRQRLAGKNPRQREIPTEQQQPQQQPQQPQQDTGASSSPSVAIIESQSVGVSPVTQPLQSETKQPRSTPSSSLGHALLPEAFHRLGYVQAGRVERGCWLERWNYEADNKHAEMVASSIGSQSGKRTNLPVSESKGYSAVVVTHLMKETGNI